jgi:hypothetical protein
LLIVSLRIFVSPLLEDSVSDRKKMRFLKSISDI